MLRNAAGFSGSNIGFPDGVEQRRLAMIDVAHDRNHRRPGHFDLADVLILHQVLEGLIGHLVFEGDDLGIGPELSSHILNQLSIERLVDGDKDAPHQEGCDEVLAAHAQLFRQILYADAFCHRDGTGDRHRLLGNLGSAEARRRGKALHWAFFGLGILLASTTLLWSSPLRARSFAWRRRQATCTARTRAGGAKSRAGTKAGTWSAKGGTSAGAGGTTGLGPRRIPRP